MRVERRLPVSPEAAAQARHALDDLGDLPDGRMRDVRLLVSELVTNAPSPDPARPSGWGLYLVAELADRWGVDSDDETLVWFELDRRAAAA